MVKWQMLLTNLKLTLLQASIEVVANLFNENLKPESLYTPDTHKYRKGNLKFAPEQIFEALSER